MHSKIKKGKSGVKPAPIKGTGRGKEEERAATRSPTRGEAIKIQTREKGQRPKT
jgi:hypothetical protein